MKSRMSLWPCLVLMGCVASFTAHAEVDQSSVNVKWSYVGGDGPAHWGMLSPAFEACDVGKAQSPINLGRKKVREPSVLSVNYRPTHLEIGEEIPDELQIGAKKTVINNGKGIQVNFHHADSKETIKFAGDEYVLDQLHFHSPSETLWHKQSVPIEIHFVHQGKDGKVAVMAVLVKGGEENPALKVILDHIPKEKNRVFEIRDAKISPAELLPADKKYYAFTGSLTTPPCTEGLQWVVLSSPITASPAQILRIRQEIGGNNARPVQPLNDRVLTHALMN